MGFLLYNCYDEGTGRSFDSGKIEVTSFNPLIRKYEFSRIRIYLPCVGNVGTLGGR